MLNMVRDILLYLWQLPQTLVGLVLLMFYKPYDAFTYPSGATVYHSEKMAGGISLGEIIIVSKRSSATTICHELGHSMQSRMLGPLYLIIIGLPSLLWAATRRRLFPRKNYYSFYTERWADKLMDIER